MGFKQPPAKKYPQANVLACVPTTITILDVDLVSGSAISQRTTATRTNQSHLVSNRNQHRILHPRSEHPKQQIEPVKREAWENPRFCILRMNADCDEKRSISECAT